MALLIVFMILVAVIGLLLLSDHPVALVFYFISIGLVFAWAIYKTRERKEAESNNSKSAPNKDSKSPYSAQRNSIGLSSIQRESIQNSIKQLRESAELVNQTVNPEVFFGRMKFVLETLMYLQTFEGKYNFGNSTPTNDLDAILGNLESTVSSFISRAYNSCLMSASKLKTEKGRANRISRFAEEMRKAFEKADTFWPGDNMKPHYTGVLYTEENLKEVQQLASNQVDWSMVSQEQVQL